MYVNRQNQKPLSKVQIASHNFVVQRVDGQTNVGWYNAVVPPIPTGTGVDVCRRYKAYSIAPDVRPLKSSPD